MSGAFCGFKKGLL